MEPMNRLSSRWLCAAAAVGAAVLLSAPLAQAGSARRGKTIRLFNGKDMSNFYTWLVDTKYQDPDKVFGVDMVDGVPAIRVTGKHYGAFVTKQEYDNYHLVAE